MSDSEREELLRLREAYSRVLAKNQHLTQLIKQLQQQLKQSLEGNAELRKLLGDLQSKLDVLIAQSKKRNKRDYGPKTEKHNPRPAAVQPRQRNSDAASENEKSTGIKHILENARNLPHEPTAHLVKPEDAICPDCCIQTEFVSSLLTHQLEMVSASPKVLDHNQEPRAGPKCKQYIVTVEKSCPPIPGSYAGPRLLAEVVVGKLDDGLPNNRQQKIFALQNVTIPRSTHAIHRKHALLAARDAEGKTAQGVSVRSLE